MWSSSCARDDIFPIESGMEVQTVVWHIENGQALPLALENLRNNGRYFIISQENPFYVRHLREFKRKRSVEICIANM